MDSNEIEARINALRRALADTKNKVAEAQLRANWQNMTAKRKMWREEIDALKNELTTR